MKIEIEYKREIGKGKRKMVMGREKGYKGVGFGGI